LSTQTVPGVTGWSDVREGLCDNVRTQMCPPMSRDFVTVSQYTDRSKRHRLERLGVCDVQSAQAQTVLSVTVWSGWGGGWAAVVLGWLRWQRRSCGVLAGRLR